MILSIAQCVWNLTKAFWYLPSFHPTTKGFLVEFWVGIKLRHTCITYFAKSKTEPSRRCKSYTLIKTCKCVEFVYNLSNAKIFFLYSFDHDSLSLLFKGCLLFKSMGYLISFFLFLSFSSCSLACFFSSHAF